MITSVIHVETYLMLLKHLDTMIMITLKIGETMTKREYSMFNSKTS